MSKKVIYRIVFGLTMLIFVGIIGIWLLQEGEPANVSQTCSAITTTVNNDRSDSEIFETANLKHSIALEEILDTNMPTNSIPALYNPKFVNINELSSTDSSVSGIGVVIGSEARFYPFNILIWHTLVNDCIQGVPIVVSFCPLCQTGLVHKRVVGEQILDFEVSGKVWLENLLMTDSKSGSLWSSVLGEAIVGKYSTTILEQVPANITTLGYWGKIHPDSLVVSKNTGYKRPYDALLDYKSLTVKERNYSLSEFVVVNNLNYNTMYTIKPIGESSSFPQVQIYFEEENIKLILSDIQQSDVLVAPRYIWESIFVDAQIAD